VPYTTYEVFLPDALDDSDVLRIVGAVLSRLGVATPPVSIAEPWTIRVQLPGLTHDARIHIEGRPNALFRRAFEQDYGMIPGASFGVDAEFPRVEGSDAIAIVTTAFLRSSDCDLIITNNDGADGTAEIMRRRDGACTFARWTYAAAYEAAVRRG
jgi:hypothetical protein